MAKNGMPIATTTPSNSSPPIRSGLMSPIPTTKRQRMQLLIGALDLERSSYMKHWMQLSSNILPRRGRFFVTDANRSDRRSTDIIDSTATFAAGTLSAGMMGGVTSPSRPWFRLTIGDPDLSEQEDVQVWLHDVAQRLNTVFLKSNLYDELPIVYKDLGVFGTAPILVEEDDEDVIRCSSIPVGSYYLGLDDKGRVRVYARKFLMTVRQIVEKFGQFTSDGYLDPSNLSTQVQSYYNANQLETWIEVAHVVEPNRDYLPKLRVSKYKRFYECYYETGTSTTGTSANYQPDVFLREGGYDEFPVLAPRWEVTGEDTYATNCPGMVALGDIKQLQFGERKKGQALDLMVRPPLNAPASMKRAKTSILPGDVNYRGRGETEGLTAVFEVGLQIDQLREEQNDIRRRIDTAFYTDLFLMLEQIDPGKMTAYEVNERIQERMLVLGPVLERLNQDLLDPLIDRTFAIMNRRGMIPPAPESLQGSPLRVEYISIMAQAQKQVALNSIERFSGFVQGLAATDPSVLDVVDYDQIIKDYAEGSGVEPKSVRPADQVAGIRAQRAQVQEQQHAAEMATAGAKSARDLSQANTDGPNALADILAGAQSTGGGASPSMVPTGA